MRQLFPNLVGNALKFRRPDVPPALHVSSRESATHVEIRVADNGIGFDMKHKDRIFQVFERLHGRLEYEGTGIGLSVCAKIVERHGGTLDVDSTVGEGTTFTISLPKG